MNKEHIWQNIYKEANTKDSKPDMVKLRQNLSAVLPEWDSNKWDFINATNIINTGDFWWHISHLEVKLIPIVSRFFISNPICSKPRLEFCSILLDYTVVEPHVAITLGIIKAYSLYKLFPYRVNRAEELDIYVHVPTGSGPLIVSPDGLLLEIPINQRLHEGQLVPKKHINDASVVLEDWMQ